MIYVTGDTHGKRERMEELLTLLRSLEPGSEPNRVLVCGDFGYLFYDQKPEQRFLDHVEEELVKCGGEIAFCDGNHENYDALNRLPVETWQGGQVQFLRPHIIHMMRGQHFTLEGKHLFVFGGASSTDKDWRMALEAANPREKCWWEEERPVDQDYHAATQTLEQWGKQVDYIITHTAPKKTLLHLSMYPIQEDYELVGFLDWVRTEVPYSRWYAGHLHLDEDCLDNVTCLYQRVIPLGECLSGE